MFVHDIAIGIAALSAVLGLIWLASRLARANGFARAPRNARLRLLHALALDARRRVVLIALDGREILLLTGGPADLVLMPCPIETTPSAPATRDVA